MTSADITRYGITGAAVALALVIRLRRVGKHQRLRLETLWIIPTIFLLLAGAIFYQNPPSGLGWLWIGIGLIVGAAVGWQRARFVQVGIDPETHLLYQRTSLTALIFIVALMAVRWALRSVILIGDEHWHFGAMLVSDIFIAFAVGVLSFYRIELFIRAKRLLRDH